MHFIFPFKRGQLVCGAGRKTELTCIVSLRLSCAGKIILGDSNYKKVEGEIYLLNDG